MIKILVAEDEKIMLDILESELDHAGYDVTAAKDGAEASALCSENHYDIILLDVKMPHKSGIEVLEEIRADSKLPVVIMITAFASIENAVEAMKLGADDYITKPYDINELLNKISDIVKIRNLKRKIMATDDDFGTVLCRDNNFLWQIKHTINKIKDLNITVLITGEHGSGKGVVAKEIHYSSNRKDLPFIHVDCASLPEHLIESELFGYEKGAFTGASRNKKGKFEMAEGGTIFLDEIGTLPRNLQSKLLIAIQEKTIDRVGGMKRVPYKARIIAATNENLEKSVEEKKFRQDLYYRLNVVRIEVPPLRERQDDIIKLTKQFIERSKKNMNKFVRHIDSQFWECLQCYEWPGNVRELENVIESVIALCDSENLTVGDLPDRISKNKNRENSSNINDADISLKDQEYYAIMAALEKFAGHREKTAEYLGISRRSLQYKLKKHHIVDDDEMRTSLEDQEYYAIMAALEKFDGHREKTAEYLDISRRSLQYKLKKYNIIKT